MNNYNNIKLQLKFNELSFWKCTNGHEWEERVLPKGSICPDCKFESELLIDKRPDLIKQWHPYKNNHIAFEKVLFQSTALIWWCCHKGHEWNSSLQERISSDSDCLVCKKNTLKNINNSLELMSPKLSKEWNYELNENNKPIEIYFLTIEKYWWKCKKGHSWEEAVLRRQQGSTCPHCDLEKVTFDEELFADFGGTQRSII